MSGVRDVFSIKNQKRPALVLDSATALRHHSMSSPTGSAGTRVRVPRSNRTRFAKTDCRWNLACGAQFAYL